MRRSGWLGSHPSAAGRGWWVLWCGWWFLWLVFFAALALPGAQQWLAGLESSQKRPESSSGGKQRRGIKHDATFIFAFVVMMVKAYPHQALKGGYFVFVWRVGT